MAHLPTTHPPTPPPAPAPAVGRGAEVLSGLKWATQLVQDTTELVVILFVSWTAMSLKNRVLHWLTHGVLADS